MCPGDIWPPGICFAKTAFSVGARLDQGRPLVLRDWLVFQPLLHSSRYIGHMYYYSTFSRAWVQGDGRRERQKWFLVDAYPGIRPRIGVRGTLSQGWRVGRRGLTMAGDKPQPYIESEQLQQNMLAIALADVS